jgi:23S rRNA pseudouridine1911/1915/1917 synthase
MDEQTPTAGPRRVEIDAPLAGERLDRALAARLDDLSRSRIKALIEQGRVADASGATIGDASRRVKPGEAYTVDVPEAEAATPQAQAMDLVVLFEDAHLLVLDKPAGLVVHPAPGNPDRTLVNALLAHCGDSLAGVGGVRRPGIVHRLDKDTSGLMVVAKTDPAHRGLSEQFAVHSIERAYQALVWGAPSPRSGEIEGAIGRHPKHRQRMAVVERNGKAARTSYRTKQTWGLPEAPAMALVECRLHTGRTHQVRVHMAHRGCPLVGDPLYGGRAARRKSDWGEVVKGFPRQALHAFRLGFVHPITGQRVDFKSELPPDMQGLIDALIRA